jgi:hypothetical protein
LAVDAMNEPSAYLAGRRIVEAGKALPKHVAADPTTNLKDWRLNLIRGQAGSFLAFRAVSSLTARPISKPGAQKNLTPLVGRGSYLPAGRASYIETAPTGRKRSGLK